MSFNKWRNYFLKQHTKYGLEERIQRGDLQPAGEFIAASIKILCCSERREAADGRHVLTNQHVVVNDVPLPGSKFPVQEQVEFQQIRGQDNHISLQVGEADRIHLRESSPAPEEEGADAVPGILKG